MNYDTMIELDNVTIDDCIVLYEKKGIFTIINDGRVTDFTKEVG